MVEDSPEKEVHREKRSRPLCSPWTCTAARSPTSQHRRLTQPSRATRPRRFPLPGTGGAFASYWNDSATPE